ncbi:hypothetical protein PAHAL_4G303900 [Panicum hallii]|uniref:Replication factor A C-terminal domain-containing protein n=1 Tax=Panicum hallii TaxID=206008 RepID=A0A2S3HLL0_9POAL|nr:hypothetical protein PAHAL_4G303900 [Panicum hallii]
MHQPVTLAQQLAYNEPNTFVAEHRKISDIKYLHPFTNKKTEWLVTVKVMKIDKSWWYNSCKKCLKTAKPHGNTYKCTNHTCNTIGVINPRYKLAITAGDETGDTEFILFGRIAQRLIKRTVDALIADNPPGFIPDEITRLLEKVFTFNVSFTENTISSGNVSFQVNAIVAEIDDGNPLPLMPIGSQSSSLVLSQSAGSSVQATPEKDITFTLTSPATRTKRARSPAALQDTESSSLINMVGPVATSPVITGCSTRETEHSATQKRARATPGKKTAKRLFADEDAKKDDKDYSSAATSETRSVEEDA